MNVEFNTRKKLDALIGQISQLLLSDFPHASSRTALEAMEAYFSAHISRLDRAIKSGDDKFISTVCVTINERIYQYLPILGFLLRSTNIRNAFEAYHSLLQLARALIGPRAEVIVSSEWDFSPLTYPLTVTVLPQYVLIGMPSSESSNALILPLAGHELGHSVWENERLEDRYASVVEARARKYLESKWTTFQQASQRYAGIRFSDQLLLADRDLIDVISKIVELSLSQVEETFCDAVGVHLFGASYAFAFHYLLAPSFGGVRAVEYPPLNVRADNIATLGRLDLRRVGLSNYSRQFRDKQPALAPQDEYILSAADEIAQEMAKAAYERASQIVRAKALPFLPNETAQDQILEMFKHGVPANAPRSISDILNAGWAYVMEQKPTFDESERNLIEWISELILKSVEVLEYRMRTNHA